MELFRSFSLLVVGAFKRIYWILPTLLLDPFELTKKLTGVSYETPRWSIWTLFTLGWLVAIVLTYHDLRKEKIALENENTRNITTTNSPAASVFIFEVLHWIFGFPGDGQFPLPEEKWFPKSVSSDTLLLKILVQFTSTNVMLVESIELILMGKRIRSNWVSLPVIGTYSRYIYLEIPKWVSAGKHPLKLVAAANGKEWESSPACEADFPAKA